MSCIVSVVSILRDCIWIIQSFQFSWPMSVYTPQFWMSKLSSLFFSFSFDILIALIIESCQHGCSIQIYCIIRSNWLSLSTLHLITTITSYFVQHYATVHIIFKHINIHSSFSQCVRFFFFSFSRKWIILHIFTAIYVSARNKRVSELTN